MIKQDKGWKTKIKKQCQLYLYNTVVGGRVCEEGENFLKDVLELHPEKTDKIGVGVDHFEVRKNCWNGLTFWLIRVDGTETDFSFLKCLAPPTPMDDFTKACRHAVSPDIISFKQSVFNTGETVICPITSEILTKNNVHIDHAPPWTFNLIAKSFAEKFQDLQSEIKPTTDGEVATVFLRKEVEEEFRKYHISLATLRAVSIQANLSLLKKS